MGKDNNIKNNYNIWDNTSTWIDGGEEWSTHFNGTDNLWNNILLPRIKDYIKGDVLEIAPGHGRMTRKLLESDINLDVNGWSPNKHITPHGFLIILLYSIHSLSVSITLSHLHRVVP